MKLRGSVEGRMERHCSSVFDSSITDIIEIRMPDNGDRMMAT